MSEWRYRWDRHRGTLYLDQFTIFELDSLREIAKVRARYPGALKNAMLMAAAPALLKAAIAALEDGEEFRLSETVKQQLRDAINLARKEPYDGLHPLVKEELERTVPRTAYSPARGGGDNA